MNTDMRRLAIILFLLCCNALMVGALEIESAHGTVSLDSRHIYVDMEMDVAMASREYCFRDLSEAIGYISAQPDKDSFHIYIAPGVYWLDKSDVSESRRQRGGGVRSSISLECDNLKFIGLSDNPEDVIIAGNRSSSQGAAAGPMLSIGGDGFQAENVTFGNYCNIDLVYPANPALNAQKRSDSMVPAQMAVCSGDRNLFRNCRFIGRGALGPFVGGKRTLYDGCYFECGDDALNGNCVYLNCDFNLYGAKPLTSATGTGVAFLGCDFVSHTRGIQYLTGSGGQIALVDCRFDGEMTDVSWTQYAQGYSKCYQSGVTMDDGEYMISEDTLQTVYMDGLPLMDAYKFTYAGKEYYNIYNLLSGSDGWDPMEMSAIVSKAEVYYSKPLTQIPVSLSLTASQTEIGNGIPPAKIDVAVQLMSGEFVSPRFIGWSTSDECVIIDETSVSDGSCLAYSNNTLASLSPRQVTVDAVTESGLEAIAHLTIVPEKPPVPLFAEKPVLLQSIDGSYNVSFGQNESDSVANPVISWYNTKDADGVGGYKLLKWPNNGALLKRYAPTAGDAGRYIAARVDVGGDNAEPSGSIFLINDTPVPEKISKKKEHRLYTDFSDFPVTLQTEVVCGAWTVDNYKPSGFERLEWNASGDNWVYSVADSEFRTGGLIQKNRGARILYTPSDCKYGDMRVETALAPFGDAFLSSDINSGQFLDVYIKFDTKTLSGYGLRIEQTPLNENALDFTLVEYYGGRTVALTDPVTSIGLKDGCVIMLSVSKHLLTATVASSGNGQTVGSVSMKAEVAGNRFGGTGCLVAGSAGNSAIMLKSFEINWK